MSTPGFDPMQEQRLERLFKMSLRLGDTIEADIHALETGDLANLAAITPEIGQLIATYGREVDAVKTGGGVKGAPAALAAQVKQAAARLKMLLARHQRLADAMRHTSEGLVQSVAEEVDRTRRALTPYSPNPAVKPASSGPIIYNTTV